jgi:hypothetical protein
VLAIQLYIFDPEDAKKKGKPFELSWSLASASKEQVESGVKLLEVLSHKLSQHLLERE